MPAGAGTRRYEDWVRWLMEGFRCRLCPPTRPLAGEKPQRYISPAALGCRCSGDGGWCRRPVPGSIPDRSPGHAFLPIAHADYHQNTRVQQWGPLVGGSARVPMSPASPLWIPASAGTTSWAIGMTRLAGVTWTRKRHWNHLFAHHRWHKGTRATCRA